MSTNNNKIYKLTEQRSKRVNVIIEEFRTIFKTCNSRTVFKGWTEKAQ